MQATQQPVAIITGASSGIGLGITQALLERGWRVVGTSRTISKSKDLKPSPDLRGQQEGNRRQGGWKQPSSISAVLICWSTMPESSFRRRLPTTLKKTTIW